MARRSFPERVEPVLIGGLVAGIALIAQRTSVAVYRAGLVILVASTLLQIAVGNLHRKACTWRSLRFIAVILCVVAAVFGAGILLVPALAQLGR